MSIATASIDLFDSVWRRRIARNRPCARKCQLISIELSLDSHTRLLSSFSLLIYIYLTPSAVSFHIFIYISCATTNSSTMWCSVRSFEIYLSYKKSKEMKKMVWKTLAVVWILKCSHAFNNHLLNTQNIIMFQSTQTKVKRKTTSTAKWIIFFQCWILPPNNARIDDLRPNPLYKRCKCCTGWILNFQQLICWPGSHGEIGNSHELFKNKFTLTSIRFNFNGTLKVVQCSAHQHCAIKIKTCAPAEGIIRNK